jgi:hypothetical protein
MIKVVFIPPNEIQYKSVEYYVRTDNYKIAESSAKRRLIGDGIDPWIFEFIVMANINVINP